MPLIKAIEQVRALQPKKSRAEVHMYLEYAGLASIRVPDPYYGNYRDFEYVLDCARGGK